MPSLLVVEDDPDIRQALETYGKHRGYEVSTAADGLTAVEMGLNNRPDVVLLDINLPGMDGRDVLAKYNEAGLTDSTIVIFLTARDSQSDRLVGLELGAVDYETKPLDFALLFNKIQYALEKRG